MLIKYYHTILETLPVATVVRLVNSISQLLYYKVNFSITLIEQVIYSSSLYLLKSITELSDTHLDIDVCCTHSSHCHHHCTVDPQNLVVDYCIAFFDHESHLHKLHCRIPKWTSHSNLHQLKEVFLLNFPLLFRY